MRTDKTKGATPIKSLPRDKAALSSNATSTSVARAFSVLDILATRGQKGYSLMEAAGRLRMSKSTTHRYLVTLEKLGAVERDPQDRFHLGLKIIELAGITLADNDLRRLGESFLNALASQTEETVHLAVPDGTDVVYIAKADSAHAIRMYSHIGARAPMYSTSLGKAILAFSPAGLLDQVFRTTLSARTRHTITSRTELVKELENIRAQGYAVDDEENEVGVCCVGAPVLDYTARPIGAISISGPVERMTRARRLELGPTIRDACLELSRRMGYVPRSSTAGSAWLARENRIV